ncbi:MAG: hypothetical protein U0869_15255 [Chloroflexota bacterium]
MTRSGDPRMALRRSRVVALPLALAGVLAVVPGGAAAGAAGAPNGSPGTGGDALEVLPLNTQLWIGTNAIVVDLRDAAGARLEPRSQAVTVTPTDPGGVAGDPVAFKAMQLVPGGPWWAKGDLAFDRAGAWGLDVMADEGGRVWTGAATIEVSPDDGTPALGAPVPDTATPTLASSGYHLETITTDPEPEPQFYWSSVADALAQHRAFVLAVDSVGIRTSDACGGAVGHLRHLQKEFPGLLLIHAEPWVEALRDGTLQLDPPGGPPVPAPWTVAWGVTSAPWMFVVDQDGRLRAKLNDVFGSDELRAAVREIAPWAPGGH